MDFLVDTNVFSEPLKRRPDAAVAGWLAENESKVFVSTVTIAEIRRGIERLSGGARRDQLQSWLSDIGRTMKGSILGFNRSVAHAWGQMQGRLDLQGIRLSPFDGLIAATAIRYDLVLVTRNVSDLEHAPVRLLNPFP